MALLALFRPDYTHDDEGPVFDLNAALARFDPAPDEDEDEPAPIEDEEEDPVFDGALLLWAFFRDVHLIRGSIVEMEKPHLDIDPTHTVTKNLPKGVKGR